MIALVFPFQAELNAFLAGMESVALKEQSFGSLRTFTVQGRPRLRLAVCGQGKVEAALSCQILAQALSPSAYILLGSACALDPTLKAGDLVLADPCIEYDFQHGPPPEGAASAPSPNHHPSFKPKHALPAAGSGIKAGTILSADRNIFEPAEKKELHRTYGALASAWEGAGFHRFLKRNQAKGWEIRLITEECHEGRPAMEDLHQRMRGGFASLHSLVQALE